MMILPSVILYRGPCGAWLGLPGARHGPSTEGESRAVTTNCRSCWPGGTLMTAALRMAAPVAQRAPIAGDTRMYAVVVRRRARLPDRWQCRPGGTNR